MITGEGEEAGRPPPVGGRDFDERRAPVLVMTPRQAGSLCRVMYTSAANRPIHSGRRRQSRFFRHGIGIDVLSPDHVGGDRCREPVGVDFPGGRLGSRPTFAFAPPGAVGALQLARDRSHAWRLNSGAMLRIAHYDEVGDLVHVALDLAVRSGVKATQS